MVTPVSGAAAADRRRFGKGPCVSAGEETHCDGEASHVRRRLSGERTGLLLVGPALLTLSASPVQAAGPAAHFVEVCTAQGITWMAIPDTGRTPGDESDKANGHAACAHILRPRNPLRPRNRAEV
jgi:hypothetical protein